MMTDMYQKVGPACNCACPFPPTFHRFLLVVMMTAPFAWSASVDGGFEVASVKLSANQSAVPGVGGLAPIPAGPIATLSLSHVTLKGLVMSAYGVRSLSIEGPSWMDSTYYDVSAKVPAGANRQQVAEMLQTLLIERLGMTVRWQMRTVSGWGLVTGSTPLKLKKTALPGDAADWGPEGAPNSHARLARKDVMRTLTLEGYSMQALANAVRGEVHEPVQDLTGVKGAFDFTLEGETDNPADIMAGMSAASVKKSLRSYGLDLIRQKVEVKTLRVDSANKIPKPN